MSGVYIRGMEMPKSCYECHIRQRKGLKIVCPILQEEFTMADVNIFSFRLKDCPLMLVPDHGRLIDAFDTVRTLCNKGLFIHAETVSDMPTIIPADFAKDTNVPTKVADKEVGL